MDYKQQQDLNEAIDNIINESHMTGKTVVVKGKKGKVGKQVSTDGDTSADEVYNVKFDDGKTENIPARDMEISETSVVGSLSIDDGGRSKNSEMAKLLNKSQQALLSATKSKSYRTLTTKQQKEIKNLRKSIIKLSSQFST